MKQDKVVVVRLTKKTSELKNFLYENSRNNSLKTREICDKMASIQDALFGANGEEKYAEIAEKIDELRKFLAYFDSCLEDMQFVCNGFETLKEE